MVTQHTPTLGRPPRAHGMPLGAAAVGIGLAAILAVALLVWRGGRESEQPAPAEPAPVPVATTGGTAAAARSLTVFLVATAEQAGLVAAEFEGLDPERRYGDVSAVVVGSDEEARRLAAFIMELDRARDLEGLGPIQLVEWRPHAAVGADRGACADGGAGDPTLARFTCR